MSKQSQIPNPKLVLSRAEGSKTCPEQSRRIQNPKFKVIAWSFVPAVITLVIVTLVNFYAYRYVTETLAVGRNQELRLLIALSVVAQALIVLLTSIGYQTWIARENTRLLEAEQRQAEQLRLISEVGHQITSILDVDQLLCEIVCQVSEVLGYYLVGIGLIEGDEVVMKTGVGPYWETAGCDPLHLKVGQEGIVGWVGGAGEPLLAPDVTQESRYYHVPQITETRSELAVPLRTKDKRTQSVRIIGVLDIQSRRLDAFDENDVVVLQSLANQAAMAIENARLFKAEQRRAEQFRLMNEMGRRLTSIMAVDELLGQITRLIRETLGYFRVSIGLIEGDELVFKAAVGPGWDPPWRGGMHIKVGKEGVTGWVASMGEPLLVPDVSQEPRFLPTSASPPSRSELAVPLKTKDKRMQSVRIIGVLNVESDRLDDFDEDDVVVLQSLAGQAAMAIENACLFEAERRRAEQFRLMNEVGRRITSILAADELLWQIVRLIGETLGYSRAGIGLIERDELVFKAVIGEPGLDYTSRPPLRLKVGEEGITGWVASAGEPLLVPDVSQDPRFLPTTEKAPAFGSELAVPIKAKGEIIGVLNVESKHLDAFDEDDLVVLQSLASQAAVAIENARLYERAQQLAAIEERHRLARDLHDSVTQALYAMTLYSEAAAGQLSSGHVDMAAKHLLELQNITREALAEMRLLIYELRPPVLEEEGLVAALQARLQAVEERVGLRTEFKLELEGNLPSKVEEGLYRIAQETLNNALKHANARKIMVYLNYASRERTVTLEIADDGIGFDPMTAWERGGVGLSAMEERAAELGGRLIVQSKPGEGTRVLVEVFT